MVRLYAHFSLEHLAPHGEQLATLRDGSERAYGTNMTQPKKRQEAKGAKCLFLMARPERLELPTPWFEAKCSIQLSYGR